MSDFLYSTKGIFKTPIRLNEREEIDIWDMLHNYPTFQIGISAFFGMAFCQPPEVKMPKLRLKAGEDMEILLKTDIEKWRRDVYVRLKAFGIVPYFIESVNDEYIPIVPPTFSGYIKTYYDYHKKEQKYEWYWNDQISTDSARGIEWIVEYPPNLDGTFTSPAKSMLRLWKDYKLTMDDAQRVGHMTSRLPIFLEKNPPKNKPGDDALTGMAFGDVEEGFVDEQLHERAQRLDIMERSTLNKAMSYVNSKNRGVSDSISVSSPALWSEKELERQKREGNNWYDRSVALPQYIKAVQLLAPRMSRDPIQISTRIDQLSGAIVDFPIDMVFSQHASKTANSEMTLRYANERIKDVLGRFECYYKKMLLQCYGRKFKAEQTKWARNIVLQRKKPMSRQEYLELSNLFEVQVIMACTPLTNMQQIETMWRNGLITQETYAKHAAGLLNIPKSDLEIQKIDLIYPGTLQELKMKQKYAPKIYQNSGTKRDKQETTTPESDPNNNNNNDREPKRRKKTPSSSGGTVSATTDKPK